MTIERTMERGPRGHRPADGFFGEAPARVTMTRAGREASAGA